jgi:hypothetical protein
MTDYKIPADLNFIDGLSISTLSMKYFVKNTIRSNFFYLRFWSSDNLFDNDESSESKI